MGCPDRFDVAFLRLIWTYPTRQSPQGPRRGGRTWRSCELRAFAHASGGARVPSRPGAHRRRRWRPVGWSRGDPEDLRHRDRVRHRASAAPSESNPIAASSMLINAYVNELARERGGSPAAPKVGWDFEDESPGNDARGGAAPRDHGPRGRDPPGQRRAHQRRPLLRRPRPPRAVDARVRRRPLDRGVRPGRRADPAARRWTAAKRLLPDGQEIVVYKNNSDGKGNSYGCHENYLMDRPVPFGRIVTHATPHFVTRQIFTGAGKVGSEAPGITIDDVPFQLTQRADFFEEEVGLETTLKRPIVNTRDEPHSDAQKYRRLHVIVGDANLSEVATFLKVGTTSLVLAMIEDDFLPARLRVQRRRCGPCARCRYDLTLRLPLELVDGTTITALDVQWELLRPGPQVRRGARARVRRRGRRRGGPAPVGGGAHRRSRPTRCAGRPARLGGQVPPDRRLPRAPRPRLGRRPPGRHGPAVPRPAAGEVAGRPGRPASGSPTTPRSSGRMTEPPTDTRAYFRGKCLQRWADDIVAANWDSLVFDIGRDPLRRVPDDGTARAEPRPTSVRLLAECDDLGRVAGSAGVAEPTRTVDEQVRRPKREIANG